jgi:hypothetical protein
MSSQPISVTLKPCFFLVFLSFEAMLLGVSLIAFLYTLKYSDVIYGNDNGILLDFNVDGNIWENM